MTIKTLTQEQAKKLLKRNFFLEALKRELALEYRKQMSENIKRSLRNKKNKDRSQ